MQKTTTTHSKKKRCARAVLIAAFCLSPACDMAAGGAADGSDPALDLAQQADRVRERRATEIRLDPQTRRTYHIASSAPLRIAVDNHNDGPVRVSVDSHLPDGRVQNAESQAVRSPTVTVAATAFGTLHIIEIYNTSPTVKLDGTLVIEPQTATVPAAGTRETAADNDGHVVLLTREQMNSAAGSPERRLTGELARNLLEGWRLTAFDYRQGEPYTPTVLEEKDSRLTVQTGVPRLVEINVNRDVRDRQTPVGFAYPRPAGADQATHLLWVKHATRGWRAVHGTAREVQDHLGRLGAGWTIQQAFYAGPANAFVWIAKQNQFALLEGSLSAVETSLRARARDGWRPQAYVYEGATPAVAWVTKQDDYNVVIAPSLEELTRRVADQVRDGWQPAEFIYTGTGSALWLGHEGDGRHLFAGAPHANALDELLDAQLKRGYAPRRLRHNGEGAVFVLVKDRR